MALNRNASITHPVIAPHLLSGCDRLGECVVASFPIDMIQAYRRSVSSSLRSCQFYVKKQSESGDWVND
jgi:hypothetical protein